METLIHRGNKIEIKNSILQAAQKRFGLYGFEKTSMHEIAMDIGMSKGSIYYYYSDKEYLYKEVVKIEQEEFLNALNDKITHLKNPEKMLKEYVELRLFYFRKLLNLGRFRSEEINGMKSFLFDSVAHFRTRELSFIQKIFKNGIEKGIFFIADTEMIAGLFLDVLKGLRVALLSKKDILYLDQNEYESIIIKSGSFTDIFINGIKHKK
jgi:AcrR family transcriptional regulator